MFGIGMYEMVVILIIALLVVGPKQLPGVARALGKMVADFRRAVNEVKSAVENEPGMADLKKARQTLDAEFHSIATQTTGVIQSEMIKARDEAEKKAREAAGDVLEFGGVAREAKKVAGELTQTATELQTLSTTPSPPLQKGRAGKSSPHKKKVAT
ncbi:MAG: Sec-independent protein translocase protein TatB [Deltaproteobacteria bacterium]|nr:Sec-independent protein translocase protein TatB [Deltaproteobacteria bacterium]